MCSLAEIEVADQICYLTQAQYTNTGFVSPGTDLLLLRPPAISLGFTILDEIFAYVTGFFFFNPTIEVVIFRLRG